MRGSEEAEGGKGEKNKKLVGEIDKVVEEKKESKKVLNCLLQKMK